MRTARLLLVFLTALAACSSGGSHGSSHGTQPGGGDGMPDAALPASCKGKDIESSGSLDVDVKAGSLSGTVTVNGQAPPEGARGDLVFTDSKSGTAATAAIEPNGAATPMPHPRTARSSSTPHRCCR